MPLGLCLNSTKQRRPERGGRCHCFGGAAAEPPQGVAPTPQRRDPSLSMSSPRRSRIYVLAGVNGAGKSSIGGAAFRQRGADYYNSDEFARKLMAANPAMTQVDANSAAWHEGVRVLKRAIEERLDFAFETTLGANTIPRLLAQAASQGIEIYVWYVGLSSPTLHIQRVQGRLRPGGHDIPAQHITP